MKLQRFGCVAVVAAMLVMGSGGALRGADEAESTPKQIRGFSLQLNNKDGYKEYIKAIDELAGMGCTSINFIVAARQEDVHAEAMAIDWNNLPNQRDIERILRHAKEKGIYTILMPIVLLNKAETKEWRGVIAPPSWAVWFDHYKTYMTLMATIAHKTKVDLLCVGSELLSTEPHRSNWLDVIAKIRQTYHGKLTYSANWDHYDPDKGGPTFWDQLDYIGMNNYNELAKEPGVPVEQLDKNWLPIKEKILAFVKKEKKPFLFTEVGWHNLKNTIAEPWNYVATGDIDLGEQERAFQSFVDTWKDVGTNQFMGALIWEWVPNGDGAKTHGAYTLQGTPAMEVVRKWMGGK